MRDDRLAASRMNPFDRLRQRRPRMLHVAGLAGREETLEGVLGFLHVARLDQEAREMRARDQPFAGDIAPCALVRAGDARLRERLRHPAGARVATAANFRQPVTQHRIVRIDLQRDHVNRVAFPAHRQFRAGHERDARIPRRHTGFRQSGGFVVIGERQEVHAPCGRALHDGGGGHQAVRMGGMRMQVVAWHAAPQVGQCVARACGP